MKKLYFLRIAIVVALLSFTAACCSLGNCGGSNEKYQDSKALSINSTVRHMLATTVAIKSYDPTVKGIRGSGVVLRHRKGEPLLVLTARHVTDHLDNEMSVADCVNACNKLIPAHTIKRSEKYDIALIASDEPMKEDGPEAELANEEPSIGDDLYVCGSPNGRHFNISHGILSSVYLDRNKIKLYRTDAAVYFGNSGGPAFNTSGKIIGIVIQLEGIPIDDDSIAVVPGSGTMVPLDILYHFVHGKNLAQ